MYMNKETYERLLMDVTRFDTEDIITTSGEGGGGGGEGSGGGGGSTPPSFVPTGWELPVGF